MWWFVGGLLVGLVVGLVAIIAILNRVGRRVEEIFEIFYHR